MVVVKVLLRIVADIRLLGKLNNRIKQLPVDLAIS
jgi:hypothetical protein